MNRVLLGRQGSALAWGGAGTAGPVGMALEVDGGRDVFFGRMHIFGRMPVLDFGIHLRAVVSMTCNWALGYIGDRACGGRACR